MIAKHTQILRIPGHYHFEVGSGLPRIGVIPIIVGPLWFGMGYFAWIVAGTLLGGADRNLDRRLNIFVLPLVAAFVLTQWDYLAHRGSARVHGHGHAADDVLHLGAGGLAASDR
ncbi:hypothetical protein [Bradyrhizobium sp.]|uniref:hypothetical protein n=1 Tax=Bradyrhizobium sp. TaxID=376 RepID=UPI003C224AC6